MKKDLQERSWAEEEGMADNTNVTNKKWKLIFSYCPPQFWKESVYFHSILIPSETFDLTHQVGRSSH